MDSVSNQAILWILEDRENRTQADAAREFGLAKSTIKRAWDRRIENGACECCGQLLTMKPKAVQKPAKKSRAKASR